MTKLLLVRHGQSQANLEGYFAGQLDSPPTELGLQQAGMAARYIAASYRVDAVYTSDLLRAAAVGEAVAEITGASLVPDTRLREINAGRWEGLTFDRLAERFPSYAVWREDIGNACCDGGESVVQLQSRIVSALTEIASAHPGQTVVIATHATPIRCMQCYCSGQPIAHMKDIPWVSNASVSEFSFRDGVFSTVRAGEDCFLGDSVSKLPSNV